MITVKHTTFSRTLLDEWSALRRNLYLTTHNSHNGPTSMPPVGFEPTISAGERPQIYALECTVIGTGFLNVTLHITTLQSKCLRIIANYPRCTPISLLHTTFNVLPIHEQIHYITARFFYTSTNHTNPLIRVIGKYTLRDLHQQYKKYTHKRTKHFLL
jgi:hypothetical protein